MGYQPPKKSLKNRWLKLDDDEDEGDEGDEEEDENSSKDISTKRRPLPASQGLLRKINSMANRARTFFRINIQPIFSRLSATDEETLRTVLEDILYTTTVIPKSALQKIYTSLNNLFEEIRKNDGRELPEVVGGNRRRVNNCKNSNEFV
jgi:hypothetical protein